MGQHKHKIPPVRSPIDLVHGGACHRANERTTKQDLLTNAPTASKETHYNKNSQNAEKRQ
jgi:hypothetical protein